MGHSQTPTPIQTDNSTSAGFTNLNMQLKKSKSWDMNLHWLWDRENQKQFKVYWKRGKNNGADYFTKFHTTVHHRKMRGRYIQDVLNIITCCMTSMVNTPLCLKM